MFLIFNSRWLLFASLADQRGLFEMSETESWKETIETKMLVANN